ARVTARFRELEFRSLLERLPEIAPPPPQVEEGPPPQPSPSRGKVKGGGTEGGEEGLPAYQIITSEEALDELINCLRRAGKFSIDTETTATDAMKAELVGLAFAWQEGVAAYIPLGHLPSHPPAEQIPMLPEIEVPRTSEVRGTSVGQLPLDYTLEKLRPILEDESLEKYAHNGKYDLTVLARCGVRVQNLTFDTMIAEWLINPESRNLGLKNLAFTRLNVEMTPIAALIGTGKKQISMAEVPVEKAAPYAGADADMAYCLVGNLEAELKEKALWPLFTEVEMPLVPILVDMEMAGVLLDRKVLDEMATELGRRLAELEERIYKEVGIPFNINSTQQLSDALFVHLGLPARGLKKTKSGHYSTDATILEKLRGEHPVIEIILEHRRLSKLKSTYVDALPKLINPHTGRLHTSYNQTGTVTGRLSSSEPNLQNIPIRTEEGRQVRRAFAAGEGCLLLSADYSQVELRILAHISQDPAMLEAFGRGEDIHASTASAIYNVPLDAVTPEMRRIAKTTNFAISYGVTGFGLSQQTDLTPEEGEAFIKAYFARYPKVKEYIERTKSQAAKQGYVETLLKRRRYFPRLASSEKVHPTVRQADERAAINFPIQGTAADIIKIAMIRLYRKLKERALKTCMILQVHDELVLEAPEEEVEEVAPLVKEIMEGAFKLDAPLKVDLKVGKNWLEMEELGG
ncbi:MAG: DNA polymerase I, partial [Anaerolineae bacterium]